MCGRAARYALAPATATAPAGSRIVRVSENTSLMPALIAALSTCADNYFTSCIQGALTTRKASTDCVHRQEVQVSERQHGLRSMF